MNVDFKNLVFDEILRLFDDHVIKNGDINIRCPICGDSERDPRKKRGWILFPMTSRKDDHIHYFCHNCQASETVVRFIRRYNPGFNPGRVIFQQKMESMDLNKKDHADIINRKNTAPKQPFYDFAVNFKRLTELPEDNISRSYMVGRRCDISRLNDVFEVQDTAQLFDYIYPKYPYTEKYHKSLVENKHDSGGIMFPFYEKDNTFRTFQLRLWDAPPHLRYMTLALEPKDDVPKILGMKDLDLTKPIMIVEGTIDMYMLNNCISSTSAAQMVQVSNYLVNKLNVDKKLIHIIFDRDFAVNYQIRKYMMKVIELGYKVYLFDMFLGMPIDDLKDPNDIIKSGMMNIDQLTNEIISNSQSGMRAKLNLSHMYPVM